MFSSSSSLSTATSFFILSTATVLVSAAPALGATILANDSSVGGSSTSSEQPCAELRPELAGEDSPSSAHGSAASFITLQTVGSGRFGADEADRCAAFLGLNRASTLPDKGELLLAVIRGQLRSADLRDKGARETAFNNALKTHPCLEALLRGKNQTAAEQRSSYGRGLAQTLFRGAAEVRPAAGKGLGVFATRDIAEGETLVAETGVDPVMGQQLLNDWTLWLGEDTEKVCCNTDKSVQH